MSSKPTIAFVGLGAMGGGMAAQLVRSGFNVTGFDVYQPLVDNFIATGGKGAISPAAAVQGAEYLILMVANSSQADSVLFDAESGAAKAMAKDTTIMLCSTTAPQYLLDLREHLDEVRPDLHLLDCPVSGGSIRAANGTLSVFSAGRDRDLDKAKPVLEAISNPLYRIPGGISMGSITKMCHQHQATTNIITSAEAMGLAFAAGLDPKEVFESVMASNGASWFFGNRVPHMLENDYKTVHSAVSIILKDAGIVTSHAKSHGFPLPLASTAEQLYIQGAFAGLTKEDDAGLVRLYLPPNGSDSALKARKERINAETISDILAGIHLASSRECTAFAKHVGMDADMLYDIVTKAAGASEVYAQVVPQLKTTDGSLKSLKEALLICERLEAAIQKASAIRQPLPMASAALQQIYFQLR